MCGWTSVMEDPESNTAISSFPPIFTMRCGALAGIVWCTMQPAIHAWAPGDCGSVGMGSSLWEGAVGLLTVLEVPSGEHRSRSTLGGFAATRSLSSGRQSFWRGL